MFTACTADGSWGGAWLRPLIPAIAMLCLAALLCSCHEGGGGGDRRDESEVSAPNVVVVLVDALRADRLGPYGFTERPTTPNLDTLAGESTVFERAISQDGWTVPSVASLFTGVDPQTHGVLKFIDPGMQKDVEDVAPGAVALDSLSLEHTTLAERFRDGGYETAAFLKSDVINAGRGFDQGFEVFEFLDEKPKDRGSSGAQLTRRVLSWLAEERDPSRPFLMYVHYMDVHASYMAPPPLYGKYADELESDVDGSHRSVKKIEDSPEQATPADVEKAKAYYDEEIEYWDLQLGALISGLRELGLYGETILVVTADHGEAFLEHGSCFHHDLYQENVHIPLIVRLPHARPQRVDHWVELVGLGPTLTELAGLQPHPDWVGLSLAPTILDGTAETRPVYSEFASSRMVIDESGLKLLEKKDGVFLFDLQADPGETRNLAEDRPQEVQRLRQVLNRRVRAAVRMGEKFPKEEPRELDQEEIEALKALGYL